MRKTILGFAVAFAVSSAFADSGTVELEPVVIGLESEGVLRIPVRFSTLSEERRTITWEVTDGTAKVGTDVGDANGTFHFANSSENVGFFDIRLIEDDAKSEPKWFTVSITSVEGVTAAASNQTAKVYILDGGNGAYPTYAEKNTSLTRLENRDWGTLAASLVTGVEKKAVDSSSAAVDWDTTKEDDGWKAFADGGTVRNVVVQNDEKYEIVGGRLSENTVWESNKVYVVRNWVIVPEGMTLTMMTNTVVKFCENTGISGNVVVIGSEEEPVVWTSAKDDTIGGDTDLKADTPSYGDYNTSGTLTDTGLAIRYSTLSKWGTASAPQKVVSAKSAGIVRVPITIDTTRTTPFFVNWRTTDGRFSGQFKWATYSEGTKFIELPTEELGTGKFTVELYESQGINIALDGYRTEVTVYEDAALNTFACASGDSMRNARLENRAWTTLAASLATGLEVKAAKGSIAAVDWDTTKETDGWKHFEDGDEMRDVVVQNNEKYEIVGGRLTESTVWESNKVYVVRNWVIVPDGMTLTMTTNTVVKFCENTGISGNVKVVGTEKEPVVWTSAKDDTIGGDTDLKADTPSYGDYNTSGALTDTGLAIRYSTLSKWGAASVSEKAVAAKSAGMVRVPIMIDTTRTTPFFVNWRTTDGRFSGQFKWATYSEGTKFIEIPVTVAGKFTVELYESQGINIAVDARQTEVTVYEDAALKTFTCASGEPVAMARLENRSWGTLAASLVTGLEVKSVATNSPAIDWDTTKEANGWKQFIDGEDKREVVVQNDANYEIVGGRLTADTLWSADKVYVVRNWVIVPSGMTLTITTGTVVKFCENTGISGNVVVAGTEENPVVWTSAKDDTIGGDTDLKADTPSYGDYNTLGTLTDTGLAIRYSTLSKWGTASVTQKVVCAKSAGTVRVPITINTTRTTPFFVNWRTTDGKFFGQFKWATYSEGTKFIEIPVTAAGKFTVELYESQGINIAIDARQTGVIVYEDAALKTFTCASGEPVSMARLENRDWDTLGASLVTGVEVKSASTNSLAEAWNTAALPDGWKTFEDGDETRELLVRNDSRYVVVGGRLAGDTAWTAGKIYVVRNMVVVPSGATLTIGEGTIVKFCENTGISGNVVVSGSAATPAIFTVVADDTAGGDFDGRNAVVKYGTYSLTGTFTHTGCQMRYATNSAFPVVSVPTVIAGSKGDGIVRIPLFVSGSRTGAFSVEWEATDMTAKYSEDYKAKKGRVSWNGVSEGTKFVEIALGGAEGTEPGEKFAFALKGGADMTISETEGASTVDIYDSRWMNDTRGFHVVESEASPYATFRVAVFGTDADGGEYRDALLDWLVGKGLVEAPAEGTDDVAVATAVRAAGERLTAKGTPYWAEFIAGTDPDDEKSEFIAKVEMVEGKPVVTWEPDVNDGTGKVGARVYKVLGKESLDADLWTEVTDGKEGDYRFFKVTVDMP